MAIELIIATFADGETKAEQVLTTVKKLNKEGALELEDVAVIVKPKEGEVKIKDVGDVQKKQGTVFGAVTGAIVGLLGGPVGAVIGAAAGAATGRVTAKLADYGVSDKMIADIEKGLQPGSSAIILYVKMTWGKRAVSMLEQNGAAVIHETLDDDTFRTMPYASPNI